LPASIQLFPAPQIERANAGLPPSAVAMERSCPVLPVLGQVDGPSAAIVQAARQAGVQPVLCASPEQAQARAHASGAALVVAQAAAMLDAPGVVVATLRRGGPLRLVLSGPEFGSLAHALALEVGFDEVWPQAAPAALLWLMLAKAMAVPLANAALRQMPTSPARPQGLQVDLRDLSCRFAGRAVQLTRGSAVLLRALQRAHPDSATREVLAEALIAVSTPAAADAALALAGRRVDTQIYRLRRELAGGGLGALRIRSVRCLGYRLEGPGGSLL